MPQPKSMREAIANSKGFKGDPKGVADKADDFNAGDNIPVVVNQEEFDALVSQFGQPKANPKTGVLQFGFGEASPGGRNEGAGAKADKDKSDRGGNNKGGTAGSDKGTKDRPHQGSVNSAGLSKKELEDAGFSKGFAESSGVEAEDPTSFSSFLKNLFDRFTSPSIPTTAESAIPAVAGAAIPGGTAAIGIGQTMGDLADQTIEGIENGNIPGRVEIDNGMGKVGITNGEGYSRGNPAADDRAPNSTGLGGGMTGGRGGESPAGILSALNSNRISARLIQPLETPPVVIPSFTSAKPPANITNYGTPGAAIYPKSSVIK